MLTPHFRSSDDFAEKRTLSTSKRGTYSNASKQPDSNGRTISAVTITKELQTYRQLWEFAKHRVLVLGENPTKQVRKPRRSQKLSFMTWEQIEARIQRCGLSDADIAELWDALFLREVEIAFLDRQ